MRAKLAAITAATSLRLMESGACSRELPQPKLRPATMTSPGCTVAAKSGRASMRQARRSASGSVVTLYRPGMIASVLIAVAEEEDAAAHERGSSVAGSVIAPASADAAATAGEARKICASGLPMRPG